MKNNNTVLKKEIKDEVVMVLERRLDQKIDILNKKQKDLDEKMSTMTQNINTITHNLSTMTHNHNTLMEVLQKRMPSIDHVSSPYMLGLISCFHTGNNCQESRRPAKINKD